MIKSYWVVYAVDEYGDYIYLVGLYHHEVNAKDRVKELLEDPNHDQVYCEQLKVEDD